MCSVRLSTFVASLRPYPPVYSSGLIGTVLLLARDAGPRVGRASRAAGHQAGAAAPPSSPHRHAATDPAPHCRSRPGILVVREILGISPQPDELTSDRRKRRHRPLTPDARITSRNRVELQGGAPQIAPWGRRA
jgi:hypothetical protein